LSNYFFRSEEAPDSELAISSENPLEFNAKKKKLLGEGIQESFLHPKPFKTEKLNVPKNEKTFIMKEERKAALPKSKVPKHRFNVI
jgi:hypothetical protein